MFSGKADDQSNDKAPNQIDCERAERKSAVQFRDSLPEKITANSTDRTAKPDNEEIRRLSPYR